MTNLYVRLPIGNGDFLAESGLIMLFVVFGTRYFFLFFCSMYFCWVVSP